MWRLDVKARLNNKLLSNMCLVKLRVKLVLFLAEVSDNFTSGQSTSNTKTQESSLKCRN